MAIGRNGLNSKKATKRRKKYFKRTLAKVKSLAKRQQRERERLCAVGDMKKEHSRQEKKKKNPASTNTLGQECV